MTPAFGGQSTSNNVLNLHPARTYKRGEPVADTWILRNPSNASTLPTVLIAEHVAAPSQHPDAPLAREPGRAFDMPPHHSSQQALALPQKPDIEATKSVQSAPN